MHKLGQYTLFFLIYSFLGAIGETLFRLLTEHQLYGINGFLHLPIMPIYGFGAILIIALLGSRIRHPLLLFGIGVLLTTILEFVSHWLIEAVLGVRIWDYSQKPLNLDGRVSLDTSIGFGVAALLLVYFIHPQISRVLKRLPKQTTMIAAAIVWVVVSADFISSVIERL